MTTEDETIERTNRAIAECKALLPRTDDQIVTIARCPGVRPGYIFAQRGDVVIYCGPLKDVPDWVNVHGNDVFMSTRDVQSLLDHCRETGAEVYPGGLQ